MVIILVLPILKTDTQQRCYIAEIGRKLVPSQVTSVQIAILQNKSNFFFKYSYN